jgi:hypothetical protein
VLDMNFDEIEWHVEKVFEQRSAEAAALNRAHKK